MNKKVLITLFWLIGLLALCAGLAGLVQAVAIGKPGSLTLALGKPKGCAALVLGGLSMIISARFMTSSSPVRLKPLIMKLILVGITFITAVLFVEWYTRSHLRKTQGFNNLDKLRDITESKPIYRKGFTPLAAIVQFSTNRSLVFELRPDIDMEFGHYQLNTSSQGFRESREYTRHKPPNTFRIIGIGDSGMFGWNIHQGDTYLDVLEKTLSKGFVHEVEVLNMAVPGYNTYQEVETLVDKGLAFQPDLVLVGWCENDHHPPFFLNVFNPHNDWSTSYLYTFLFYRHEFIDRYVRPTMLKQSEMEASGIDPMILRQSGYDGMELALKRLRRLADEHAFEVIIFGPLNERIRTMADTAGLRTLDVRTLIPPGTYPENYNVYYMHPSPKGHAAIGPQLGLYLQEKGLISLNR